MRNDKSQRRKKKLADRVRREKSWAVKAARRAEFPEFVFEVTHADPEFAAVIREAVGRFRFEELPAVEQSAFKIVREKGAATALSTLRAAMAEVRTDHPENEYAQLGDIVWFLTTGELIFAKIPEPDRQRFFPLHDFRILPHRNRVVVQCSSLVRVRTSKGWAYHSRLRPTVKVDGVDYVMAFTEHVVEKIEQRLLGNRMSYAALGDVYAYFELYKHFELCRIKGDGECRDGLVRAVTFFEDCSQKRFWNRRYVDEVLGACFEAAKGKPHYRVGYCPVVLDAGFAVATSFLPPGFKKTPEYAAIRQSNFAFSERKRLESMATDDMALLRLIDSGDFSAIRCFHANGVPQVVQTHEEWFAPYKVCEYD